MFDNRVMDETSKLSRERYRSGLGARRAAPPPKLKRGSMTANYRQIRRLGSDQSWQLPTLTEAEPNDMDPRVLATRHPSD